MLFRHASRKSSDEFKSSFKIKKNTKSNMKHRCWEYIMIILDNRRDKLHKINVQHVQDNCIPQSM